MGKIQEIGLISISDDGFGLSVEPGINCPLNQLIDRNDPAGISEIIRSFYCGDTYNITEGKFYCKLLFGDRNGGTCPFYCGSLFCKGPAGTEEINCNF